MKTQKTVLLVEDDESFRESVKKLLEKENLRVFEASSGEEAIEILKTDRMIDLVLLDLYLEGMTGMEFLARTQSVDRPPVIMLTAFGDWGIYTDAVAKGALDCLPKPIKRYDLLTVIKKVFETQECA